MSSSSQTLLCHVHWLLCFLMSFCLLVIYPLQRDGLLKFNSFILINLSFALIQIDVKDEVGLNGRKRNAFERRICIVFVERCLPTG